MKASLELPKGLPEQQARAWKREMSMIVRPIVVISTVSKEGIPNAALKTNLMVVSALGEVAFCCFPEHDTHKNIIETGEFVVNLPSEEILEKIMVTAVDFPHNVNEIEKAGLTAIPSEKVKPPRIKECKFHMECKLKWRRDNIIVGEVVAASADEDLIHCSVEERQKRLGQMVLVGAGMYSRIEGVRELPLRIIAQYEEKMKKWHETCSSQCSISADRSFLLLRLLNLICLCLQVFLHVFRMFLFQFSGSLMSMIVL